MTNFPPAIKLLLSRQTRRRVLLVSLGGVIIALPLAAHAQQKPMPVIGYLHSGSPGPLTQEVAAFRQGLNGTGYVEGQNVAIEYRWAEGQSDALPMLAADLVRRQVNVIAAIGGDAAALAAKAATSTIPIVFQIGSDPIKAGLVGSLSQPGANLTGLSLLVGTLDAKRLELMHEMVPQADEIAVLISSLVAEAESRLRDLRDAARTMRLRLLPLTVNNEHDFDTAFSTISERKPGALFVFGSPFFDSRRDQIVALAAQHGVPAVYAWREFVVGGGLMSYGTSLMDASRQTGTYVGRILKGEKPADLPVQQPTKFELVINLKTAKALGITVPQSILARADEVIE
jgi:putative tryptophan/tyrosine transport system substrate-binding protein